MPSLEDALVSSANGDFGLLLLLLLISILAGTFVWAIRRLLEQNAAFNAEIVCGIKDYKTDTLTALKEHDVQAKQILDATKEISTVLRNRPCIKEK